MEAQDQSEIFCAQCPSSPHATNGTVTSSHSHKQKVGVRGVESAWPLSSLTVGAIISAPLIRGSHSKSTSRPPEGKGGEKHVLF